MEQIFYKTDEVTPGYYTVIEIEEFFTEGSTKIKLTAKSEYGEMITFWANKFLSDYFAAQPKPLQYFVISVEQSAKTTIMIVGRKIVL